MNQITVRIIRWTKEKPVFVTGACFLPGNIKKKSRALWTACKLLTKTLRDKNSRQSFLRLSFTAMTTCTVCSVFHERLSAFIN